MEGRERAVLQTADLPLRLEQVIASLKATETTSGFAELVKGETIDRTVHGVDMEGPMFDLSPEDKACEGKQDPKSGRTRPRRR